MKKRWWALGAVVLVGAGVGGWLYTHPKVDNNPQPTQKIKFYDKQVDVPQGSASQQELYSDDQFVTAMKPYKALSEGLRKADAIPGLQGAWSLKNDKDVTVKRDMVEVNTFDPQGLAVGNGHIFISAYDHSKQANSVIFVLDKKTGEYQKTIVLQHKDHAGGIAYDADRHMLWVAGYQKGNATLYAVTDDVIDNYDINSQVPVAYAASFNLETNNNTSTVAYFKNSLWVGFFTEKGQGNVQQFDISKRDDGSMTIGRQWAGSTNPNDVTSSKLIDGINQLQGIAASDDAVVMTSSFSNRDSKLVRYERDKNNNLKKGTYVIMPPYLESVAFDGDSGRMYMLFESATPAYRTKTNAVVDRVLYVDNSVFSKYDMPYKELLNPDSFSAEDAN
jgi:hypothetical protein